MSHALTLTSVLTPALYSISHQSVLQGLSKSLGAPGRPAVAALPLTLEDLTSGLRRTLGVASREKDRVAAQAAAIAWSAIVKVASSAKEPIGGEILVSDIPT